MSFRSAALIVSFVVACAALGRSCYHYYANRSTLGKTIPIHFGFNGAADHFSDASIFYIYPAISSAIAVSFLGCVVFLPYPLDCAMAVMAGCVLWTVAVTQFYAAAISKGEADRIPPKVFCLLLALILLSTIEVVVAAFFIPVKTTA